MNAHVNRLAVKSNPRQSHHRRFVASTIALAAFLAASSRTIAKVTTATATAFVAVPGPHAASFRSSPRPFAVVADSSRGKLSASRSSVAERPSPFSSASSLLPPPTVASSGPNSVDVTIERTSSNSRRIAGEAVAHAPLEDVWAILTDYDNLSTHVPNLVESKRIVPRGGSGRRVRGGIGGRVRARPGDGLYQCRLYQRGAQKVLGFKFGADVTMDMSERIDSNGGLAIDFKCVDSQFFSKFDGAWTLEALDDHRTIVRYVVDVRPKGPVPVTVLEGRIRKEVPTNVLAVVAAAMAVGGRVADELRRDDETTSTYL